MNPIDAQRFDQEGRLCIISGHHFDGNWCHAFRNTIPCDKKGEIASRCPRSCRDMLQNRFLPDLNTTGTLVVVSSMVPFNMQCELSR